MKDDEDYDFYFSEKMFNHQKYLAQIGSLVHEQKGGGLRVDHRFYSWSVEIDGVKHQFTARNPHGVDNSLNWDDVKFLGTTKNGNATLEVIDFKDHEFYTAVKKTTPKVKF